LSFASSRAANPWRIVCAGERVLPTSDALVFFGIKGDLAHKMIFPALAALVNERRLDVPAIGTRERAPSATSSKTTCCE